MNPSRDLDAQAEWPRRLITLCAGVRSHGSGGEQARADLWVLLRDCLSLLIRREASRWRPVAREDLEDLASNKALDLLTRAERGDWSPEGRSNGEVVSYLRATARHGLQRLSARSWRSVPLEPHGDGPHELGASGNGMVPAESTDHRIQSGEFAAALVDCLSGTTARSRFVWYLRAMHDMPSREIAAHPEVAATPANVDVILMRIRAQLRDCLGLKGFEPGPLPAGAFAAVWEALSHTPVPAAEWVDQ